MGLERPFDDPHEGPASQLGGARCTLADSEAVRQARAQERSAESLLALGKALSRQLRYREAIAAYTEALTLEPDNRQLLRLRAGRYLTTLQSYEAIADFSRCLVLGEEKLDCLYRIGLAHYYAGRYHCAAAAMEQCLPLCDDEMEIAVIYWHTLSAARTGEEPALLRRYRAGMAVGHHTAYEKAVRVWAGIEPFAAELTALEAEPDDLEYCIALYGLAYHPACRSTAGLLARLLPRNAFWPCFSYLAAWQDASRLLDTTY